MANIERNEVDRIVHKLLPREGRFFSMDAKPARYQVLAGIIDVTAQFRHPEGISMGGISRCPVGEFFRVGGRSDITIYNNETDVAEYRKLGELPSGFGTNNEK